MRLLLLLLFALPLPALQPAGRGALIITYHTGRNAERLDRVRIRLINDKKRLSMFPKMKSSAESSDALVKRVTIPDLPAGRYSIEFIVPNRDNVFVIPPKREVLISDGQITKIDQGIKPRYARVRASILIQEEISVKPKIVLQDSSGKIVAESSKGELENRNLLPGRYTLWFERYKNFTSPEPIHFVVTPGAAIGPFVRYYSKPY